MTAYAGAGRASGDGARSQTVAAQHGQSPRPCRRAVLELVAEAGQSVRLRGTRDLDVLLKAQESGWLLRVVPHGGGLPELDYAGVATPPYRSVSPLLLSTDFGFRAQDAIGWNPRRFHFAADPRAYTSFQQVFRSISQTQQPLPRQEAALGRLVAAAPEGTIEIVDARLVPGTADQSRAAAGVVNRFSSTAHTIEQPPTNHGTALGKIVEVSVRVSLDLTRGSAPAPGVHTVATACAGS